MKSYFAMAIEGNIFRDSKCTCEYKNRVVYLQKSSKAGICAGAKPGILAKYGQTVGCDIAHNIKSFFIVLAKLLFAAHE